MKTFRMHGEEIITRKQRESAYVEGELAFKIGERRVCNPYAASSPTLEQVWWHGWDTAEEESEGEHSHVTKRAL